MIAPPGAGASFREWLRFVERRFSAARLFFGHGTHNARDEAVWLLVHVLGIGFERVDAQADQPLTPRQARKAVQLVEARIEKRKPLAYLLNEAWLMGERFYVDERVIVPRSFIAELLPRGLRHRLRRGGPRRILDLCTGSGCLAILAAKAYPKAEVTASDISPAALQVARRNVTSHGLRERIRLVRGDLFEKLAGEPFDLILTNPPYVDAKSMSQLPAEYRREPELALASGSDGLDAVMRIISGAASHLAEHGLLVMEIGHNRARLERRTRPLRLEWLQTSAGDRFVCSTTRDNLLTAGKAEPGSPDFSRAGS